MTSQLHRTQALFIDAGPQMNCGVGHFTRLLRQAIEREQPGATSSLTLTRSEGSLAAIWRAIGEANSIVCNFPIVAWKRVMLRPLLAMAIARLRGRPVILVQHEWASLHRLRRLTYRPALLLATSIVMFSPLVRQELADDPAVGRFARKVMLAPLPPNIEAPAGKAETKLSRRLAEARARGQLVIGHFGSIYPGKQPEALLNVVAILKQRGLSLLAVFIGSFIRGMDTVKEDFNARAAALGIRDDVIVSGYVASDHEVFGLFGEVDVFCYPLEEGLTARRSSVLTCVQSGHPLVVTAAADNSEFDHHPRFKELIARGAIIPVPRGAGAEAYADAIERAWKRQPAPMAFDYDGWWRDVAKAIAAQLPQDITP